MIAPTVAEDILSDAWVQEWERLYALTPKKVWKKRQLQRSAGESVEHFQYRLLYSHLVSRGMRLIGQFLDSWKTADLFPALGVDALRKPWNEFWNEDLLATVLLRDHMHEAIRYADKIVGSKYTQYTSYSAEAFWAQMAGMCKRAARWALSNFDPETYKKKQDDGRRGGRAYRKWDLAQYLETYDLTATEAAKALGVTRPTVYAMRKHFAKVFDFSTGEVFEEAQL